jgi:hypothetical protein
MVERAAHLVDHVLPDVPVRQNATGVLTNSVVQSNPAGGLNLNQGSMADLSSLVVRTSSKATAGGNIGDVNCDAYSQVFGDVSGVGSNKCSLQANGK